MELRPNGQLNSYTWSITRPDSKNIFKHWTRDRQGCCYSVDIRAHLFSVTSGDEFFDLAKKRLKVRYRRQSEFHHQNSQNAWNKWEMANIEGMSKQNEEKMSFCFPFKSSPMEISNYTFWAIRRYGFLVACYIWLFRRFWRFWAHCSCPNAPVISSITAPAHPRATRVAVYPALFMYSMIFFCPI